MPLDRGSALLVTATHCRMSTKATEMVLCHDNGEMGQWPTSIARLHFNLQD
jgi:hypothetical protein